MPEYILKLNYIQIDAQKMQYAPGKNEEVKKRVHIFVLFAQRKWKYAQSVSYSAGEQQPYPGSRHGVQQRLKGKYYYPTHSNVGRHGKDAEAL